MTVLDGDLAVAQPGLAGAIVNYFSAHQDGLTLVHPPMICQGGEQIKAAWSSVAEIHAAINRHHIDRHSYLIAVGGGALLDMAGLAAATAHRGVRHVRMSRGGSREAIRSRSVAAALHLLRRALVGGTPGV